MRSKYVGAAGFCISKIREPQHAAAYGALAQLGERLICCLLYTSPDRPVQVIEAEKTPELQKYMEQISGVVNYVNQTFGLFKAAEALRPTKLLTPKARP